MYKSFKDMPLWREAMEIAQEIFRLSEEFPRKEDYGLTSQLRRAALSISANIAEAFGRNHTLDKMKFYVYARGSAMETENHLEYGRRVGYLSNGAVENLTKRLNNLCKDLNKLMLALKSQPKPKPKPKP
jgi:four helix bundle protein